MGDGATRTDSRPPDKGVGPKRTDALPP
jgi:hypothetical protein